jgi:hypothetical protein
MVGPVAATGSSGLSSAEPGELGREVLAAWDDFLDVARSADLSLPPGCRGGAVGTRASTSAPGTTAGCWTGCSPPPGPGTSPTRRTPTRQRRAGARAPRRLRRRRARRAAAGPRPHRPLLRRGGRADRPAAVPVDGRAAAGAVPGPRGDVRAGGPRAGPRALRRPPSVGAAARPGAGLADRRDRRAVRACRRRHRPDRSDARRWLALHQRRPRLDDRAGGRRAARRRRRARLGGGPAGRLGGRVGLPQLLLGRRLQVQQLPQWMRLAPLLEEVPGLPGGAALKAAPPA